jgi:PAS domain S-box-containing protein
MTGMDQLMSESEIPVVIADHRGIITYINESFGKAFLWKAEDLIGKALEILIPENLRDAHQMGFSRFYVTGSGTLLDQALKLKILTGDGKEILAEHTISAEQIDGEWVLGAKIRPL